MGKNSRLAAMLMPFAFFGALIGCEGNNENQGHDQLESGLRGGAHRGGSRCVRRAPTVTLSPGESAPAEPGSAVVFTVSVINNDGADVPSPEPIPLAVSNRPDGRRVRKGRLPKPAKSCPSSDFDPSVALPEGLELLQAPAPLRVAPGAQASAELVVASRPEASGAPSFTVSYAHRRDAGLVGTGTAIYRIAGGGQGCASSISIERELMITDLSVVEDPVRTAAGGAWTFGRLIEDMAGERDPSELVANLLQHWMSDRTVNGFVSPARTAMDSVLSTWPRIAGTDQLDLSRAPLRLLAIVNRIDLRDVARGQAGEGRFVFGVTTAPSDQFTVILEYKLLANTPEEVVAWANRWHALGSIPMPSAAYNEALQAITDSFAGANVAPNRPNGSALGQLRTNEIALAFPWELRQFELGTDGFFHQVSVALTPDFSFNGSSTLANFINANAATLRSGVFDVPVRFDGAPFLANAVTNNIDFWSAPGILDNEARHQFSLNTCNGCHGAETNTIFLQINPRQPGQVAQLSPFLTGSVVPDPVTGEPRSFNDLARRVGDLATLVCPADEVRAADIAATAASARVH